jgi:hydrogenase maturation protein HypF
LAEHQRTDKTIAVSFDGLGWGDDQSAWGGEFLICDLSGFERVGHLAVVPQPGADAAARRPARMGYVYLTTAFGERADALAEELLPMVSAEERRIVTRLVERNLQCPMTSSAGRLFDAAAALLGICSENTYHAQAPMELEACANEAPEETGHYPVRIECTPSAMLVVHAEDAIAAMVEDFRRNGNRNACAARFHNSIARMTLDVCGRIRNNSGLSTVTLSGGVMANAFLVERLVAWLEAEQFEVLLNERTPAGDGGVSLGQAAVAAWRLSCA